MKLRTKKENSKITYSSEGILITPSFIVPRESHLSWTIFLSTCEMHLWGFPGSSAGKESAFSAGDQGLIPGLGRFSTEGNGYPLHRREWLPTPQKGMATHSSILAWRIPMDRGAWPATQSMRSQRVGHN